MGHKVHPNGFRIGIIRDWQSKWYADKQYAEFLHEDLMLRQSIQSKYPDAGVSMVAIERQANKISITIHTARPGIVIGRGGQRVDEMRLHLESIVGKKMQLNIQEIQQPELDAYLVARTVADQIERHIAYRRAMKQAIFRTIQAGAQGMRISCAGRLGGAEIARRQTMHEGRVPLHTLRADIDYGFTEARTTLGRIGVKVWIYRGDIIPELKMVEIEEKTAESGLPTVTETGKVSIEPEPPTAAEVVEVAIEPEPPTAAEVVEMAIEPEPPTAAKAVDGKKGKTVPGAKSVRKTVKPKATRAKTVPSVQLEKASVELPISTTTEETPSTTEKEENDVTT